MLSQLKNSDNLSIKWRRADNLTQKLLWILISFSTTKARMIMKNYASLKHWPDLNSAISEFTPKSRDLWVVRKPPLWLFPTILLLLWVQTVHSRRECTVLKKRCHNCILFMSSLCSSIRAQMVNAIIIPVTIWAQKLSVQTILKKLTQMPNYYRPTHLFFLL